METTRKEVFGTTASGEMDPRKDAATCELCGRPCGPGEWGYGGPRRTILCNRALSEAEGRR